MATLTGVEFGFPDVAGWVKNIRKKMEHRRNVRITINELSQLNDRELNDMGISRCDIKYIANSSVETSSNPNLKGWA
jgi:uncharacterized protein YjiS (DUF1127 family)